VEKRRERDPHKTSVVKQKRELRIRNDSLERKGVAKEIKKPALSFLATLAFGQGVLYRGISLRI